MIALSRLSDSTFWQYYYFFFFFNFMVCMFVCVCVLCQCVDLLSFLFFVFFFCNFLLSCVHSCHLLWAITIACCHCCWHFFACSVFLFLLHAFSVAFFFSSCCLIFPCIVERRYFRRSIQLSMAQTELQKGNQMKESRRKKKKKKKTARWTQRKKKTNY